MDSSVQILHQGVKRDGTFSWVQISTSFGPLNIGSIYAPYDYSRQVVLWNWLDNNFTSISHPWLLTGDFNMINFLNNSTNQTNFIQRAKSQAWKHDLIDLLFCATK